MDTTGHFFIDTETRHTEDIKLIGGYKHAQLAEATLVTYAYEDDPVQFWEPLDDPIPPAEITAAFRDPEVRLVAHNASYDRLVVRSNFKLEAPINRWFDTMALANTMGLPGGLDMLGEVLGLGKDAKKLKDGKRLIQKFAKPRRPSKANPDLYWSKRTKPEDWARFIDYGVRDVVAMREIFKILPDWNFSGAEYDLWVRDQVMNERGLCVDMPALEAALRTINGVIDNLDAETDRITKGSLRTTRQAQVFSIYLSCRLGKTVESIAKEAVTAMLEKEPLDPISRRLLEIRQQVGKSSTAKFEKMRAAAMQTARGYVLQGMFQYYGAFRTGRWSSREVQLQNQPQGIFHGEAETLQAVDDMLLGITDIIYDDPMAVAASCIRPMLIPAQGRLLYVPDLSNIEGRVIAWVSGEEWKLEAFRAFDAGTGPDIYKLAYARSFGVDPDTVSKDQRQIGKTQELQLGYEGGVGAFANMALKFNMDLDAIYDVVWPIAKPGLKSKAEAALRRDRLRDAHDTLSDEAYLACDVLKQMWRLVHPHVVAMWANCKKAAISAIQNPGRVYRAGRFRFKVAQRWLFLVLPSGRMLAYYNPSVAKGAVRFWGLLQTDTGQRIWCEQSIHGGKMFQNGVQGVARDILAHNMPAVEEAGFDLLGSVHDEVITEAAPGRDIAELNAILATNPQWAQGLPLAAAGFSSTRYMKEA